MAEMPSEEARKLFADREPPIVTIFNKLRADTYRGVPGVEYQRAEDMNGNVLDEVVCWGDDYEESQEG